MIKLQSGGKYSGTIREFKPKKYKGENLVKREFNEDNKAKKYTFTVKGQGTITFSADDLEDAKRIAKEMGANVRSGHKKNGR